MEDPVICMPEEGQIVGPSFPIAVRCDRSRFVRAEFHANGAAVVNGTYQPFYTRHAPRTDGPVELEATLYDADGRRTPVPSVRVNVRRDLYGRNAHVSDRGRGFVFPNGRVGVIVGFNDACAWPSLEALYRNGDTASADTWVHKLRVAGVNVLRMGLEHAGTLDHLLETTPGEWNAGVVAFWDRLLPILEGEHVTVLLSPWHTQWLDDNWEVSPFNARNGGPCRQKCDWFTDSEARNAQKNRFRFLIDRWGQSRAIFAWDLLSGFEVRFDGTPEQRAAWVDDMAAFVTSYELEKHGRRHMLTVSSGVAQPTGLAGDVAFRHPRLDFASTRLYFPGSVNAPRDSVAPAEAFAGGVLHALEYIEDGRPYTDVESGPRDLPPPWLSNRPAFDDEVHHCMSWAHFASGGCGMGMRWPYRLPHTVSDGMLATARSISEVAQAFDWHLFQPMNASHRVRMDDPDVIAMASSDDRQALVWLLNHSRGRPGAKTEEARLAVRGLKPGSYLVRTWEPGSGRMLAARLAPCNAGVISLSLPPFKSDLAVTLRPWSAADSDTARALRNAYGIGS